MCLWGCGTSARAPPPSALLVWRMLLPHTHGARCSCPNHRPRGLEEEGAGWYLGGVFGRHVRGPCLKKGLSQSHGPPTPPPDGMCRLPHGASRLPHQRLRGCVWEGDIFAREGGRGGKRRRITGSGARRRGWPDRRGAETKVLFLALGRIPVRNHLRAGGPASAMTHGGTSKGGAKTCRRTSNITLGGFIPRRYPPTRAIGSKLQATSLRAGGRPCPDSSGRKLSHSLDRRLKGQTAPPVGQF